MILVDWMFIVLLIGISKANPEDEVKVDTSSNLECHNFDRCFQEFMNLLPEAFISKKLYVSDKMREDILDCLDIETSRPCSLGFVDMFGSSKEIESTCDSLGRCSKGDHQLEDYAKTNKYSFLHCLDDHKYDLMECMSNTIIETWQEFITMPNIEENYTEEAIICSLLQSFLICTRKVSIVKCGKDGSDLVRESFEPVLQDLLDSCDKILIVKLNYA